MVGGKVRNGVKTKKNSMAYLNKIYSEDPIQISQDSLLKHIQIVTANIEEVTTSFLCSIVPRINEEKPYYKALLFCNRKISFIKCST